MASERKFISKALSDYSIREYLEHELGRAGISDVSIQKTPIATRVTLTVQRPGIVVGKRGASIGTLSAALTSRFGIDNPQIEVIEVPVPSLDAKLMAERVGHQVELRDNAKQAVRFALREIMDAGAIGAEIRVSGKIVGKGGKAKAFTVRQGYLKKSGDLIKLVREGHYTAYPKAGAVGITVKILPPGTQIPDKIDLRALIPPMPAEVPAPAPVAIEVTATGEVAAEVVAAPVEPAAGEAKETPAPAEAKPKRTRKKKAAPAEEKAEEKTEEKTDEPAKDAPAE